MNRVADRIDLAIDLITLGQYGLEQIDPSSDGDERPPCRGAHRVRRPQRQGSLTAARSRTGGRVSRRRNASHVEYEWGWPSPDADGGPSSASSLWVLATA